MFRIGLGLALAALVAGMAHAADKPTYAPPPDWVKPAEIPVAAPVTDQTPVHTLLADTQARITPSGEDEYSETVFQVGSSAGLQALGNLAFPWDPSTSTLVIHRVRIIRAGQSIDLLAGGQAVTVLRRENNLERAMLDGWLTAALEPSGLQVGDILDIALTYQFADPLLKGHAQVALGISRQSPIQSLRFRALWPKGRAIRWRQLPGLPAAKVTETPDGQELEVLATNLPAQQAPKDAPVRFRRTSEIDLSDFADWSAASAVMSPLYVKAATLSPDSPLKLEAAKIKAASPDPKVQAAAALHLVQDKVRYLFLGMDLGGYMPADADVTWTRRFGDCKGKTTLLLALLHELQIQAEPAFVNSSAGNGADEQLPSLGRFDHVIVRATIGGKVYWLDGTRTGDRGLDDIETPPFEWALPVQAAAAKLEPLIQPPYERPSWDLRIHLDASAGLDTPAPAHIELLLRGDAAQGLKLELESMQTQQRDTFLRDYWRKSFDFIDAKSQTTSYDAATGEEHIVLDGVARLGWRIPPGGGAREYLTDDTLLGWKADFSRPPGPGADAPFLLSFPLYNRVQETIVLPAGGRGFRVQGADIDKTIAGYELKRRSGIKGAEFTVEASTRTLVPEIAAAEARAAEATIHGLTEQPLYVQAPQVVTEGQIGAAMAERTFLQGDHEGALAEIDKAAASEPRSPELLDERALILLRLGRAAEAVKAADAAIAARPTVDGYLMRAQARPPDQRAGALSDVAAAQKLAPDSASPYIVLGALRLQGKDTEGALKALDIAVRLDPADIQARRFRANANFAAKRRLEGLKDLDTLLASHPRDSQAASLRLQMFRQVGGDDQASAAIEAALAANPKDADALALRCWLRQAGRPASLDAALTDCDAALKQTSDFAPALFGRAAIHDAQHHYPDEIADFDQLLKADPDNGQALYLRGAANGLAGRPDEALADADRASTLFPAWTAPVVARATMRFNKKDFVGVIADTDKVIELSPGHKAEPAVYRLRGLAFANERRFDDAVKAFSEAVESNPRDAYALSLRGAAEMSLNRLDDALADFDKSLAVDQKQTVALKGRGALLSFKARYADAVEAFSKSLALAPNDTQALIERADAYHQLGKDDLALADVTAVVRLKPDSAQSYISMAAFLHLKGDQPGAIQALDKAKKIAPGDRSIAQLRAEILKSMGLYADGLQALDEAVAAAPGDPELLNTRCWYRATSGRGLTAALADCNEAIKLKPANAAYLDSRGLVELRLARLDQSISDYDAALKLRPAQADSLYGRGVAKLRNGSAKDAASDLAAAQASDPKVQDRYIGYGVRAVPIGG